MRIAISGSFERQARNALHSATSHPSNFLLEATPSQEPPCHVARSCSSFTDHLKFFIVARRRRTGAAVARNSSMVRSQCSPVTVADRKAPFVVRCPNASQRAPRRLGIPRIVHFVYGLEPNASFSWTSFVAVRSALACDAYGYTGPQAM